MNIEVRKLSADLLDDWLDFFDNSAFSNNGGWSGCYCMCYHWTESLEAKKSWNCSESDAEYNRKCAVRLIKKGIMQGYLAYCDGKAVGWVNANDKNAYDNVNFTPPWEDSEKGKRVKSIVCFCISPDLRNRGIASALLERACSDAAVEGYEYIEAYPFSHNENNAYHGPVSMYEKNGFKSCGSSDGCIIFRKYL